MPAKLKIVPAEPEPAPSHDYEWQERQRIARKNWAAVHVAADRRPFIGFTDAPKRIWRR